MTAYKTPLLVFLLAKPQELPVSQLARHVDRLHLMITDKQGPAARLFSGRNTLRPLWCSPSHKAHYSFQLSCCTLNPKVSPAVWPPMNLSFLHVVRSLFSSSLQSSSIFTILFFRLKLYIQILSKAKHLLLLPLLLQYLPNLTTAKYTRCVDIHDRGN
jgi:hypothetical protein